MLVVDSSAVLTECYSNTIAWCSITTLTREYETLSSNSHLVEESLILECIDYTIESSEIHAAISLSYEFFLEVAKSDTRTLTKSFDKPFSLFGDTGIRHRNQEVRIWEVEVGNIVKKSINANVCEKFLLLFYLGEYLCQEYSNDSYTDKEYYLPDTWEEYSRYAEYDSECIDDSAYLWLGESEFHESEVEVWWLISLHRILAGEYTGGDDIDEVYHIDSEYWECCGYLAPTDDGESCQEECEHDSSRIPHDDSSRYICPSEEVCNRYDDSQESEQEATILLTCESGISEDELDSEESEYHERYQYESTSKTRNSIREIHRVKN